MSQPTNSFHLCGTITHVHPPHYFSESDDSMLLIDVETKGEEGTYTHRVSLINEVMEDFFHHFDVGDSISIDGCLRPRPKNANEPHGEVFFELRCLHFNHVPNESEKACEEAIESAKAVPPTNTQANQAASENVVQFPTNKTTPALAKEPEKEVGNWRFPPSLPVQSRSVFKQHQDGNEDWLGGSCVYNGVLHQEVDFLNGAPIDTSLPFFPSNNNDSK